MDTPESKPDLMGSPARTAGSRRILAQLEQGGRPSSSPTRASAWSIDGWTIGLCVLLLVMCGVAWLMHTRTLTPESFRGGSAAMQVRKTTPAAENVALASDQATQREAAATITNEPSPAMSGEGATPVIAQRSNTAVAGETRMPGSTATPAPSARTAAASATRATTSATTRAAGAQAAAGGAASAAAAGGDSDVALLTALVAHTSKPASVTPERSRDVVDRQDGDTTAQLLARCKQLGLIEGMLCRSRICSGRWEADAACRAPNH